MTWDRVYFKIEFFSLTLLVNHTTQKRAKKRTGAMSVGRNSGPLVYVVETRDKSACIFK